MRSIFYILILCTYANSVAQQGPLYDSTLHRLELPYYETDAIIIQHKGYVLCFDKKHKQAKWVAYELTSQELIKKTNRSNEFLDNPYLSYVCGSEADYKNSGYDRGHLAPAADMAWDSTAMKESFYYSNMSPQVSGFNRGVWNKLEQQTRQWAARFDRVYVVCGPLIHDSAKKIGRNQIPVPYAFFKSILVVNETLCAGVAFVIPNKSTSDASEYFAISIDSAEVLTGLDLFYHLENSTEEKIEATLDTALWFAKKTSVNAPQKQQCKGTTKKGNRCVNLTLSVNGYCPHHQPKVK